MSEKIAETAGSGALHSFMDELPTDQLKQELGSFLGALAHRAIAAGTEKVGSATEMLTDYAENGGPTAKALKAAAPDLAHGKPLRGLAKAGLSSVTGMLGKALGGGKGGGKGLKVTNIVEHIDVGAPLDLTYNVWTQFQDFPNFMKKVETVSQEQEAKLNWKAQVFLSHRSWRSTITEQIPDNRIVWKSEGDKGHVDGTVTFHAIGQPELTRILVVLEYHPGGVIENIGNLWRAQGRRVRLELKHFRRHVMTQVITNPDEVEGWRGEIRDGEVVSDGQARDQEGRDQENGDRTARGEDQPSAGVDSDMQDRDHDEDQADDEDRADQDYDEDEEDEDRADDEDEDHDGNQAGDNYDEDEDEEEEEEDRDHDEGQAHYDEDPEPQEARRGGSDRGGDGRSSPRHPVKSGARLTRGWEKIIGDTDRSVGAEHHRAYADYHTVYASSASPPTRSSPPHETSTAPSTAPGREATPPPLPRTPAAPPTAPARA